MSHTFPFYYLDGQFLPLATFPVCPNRITITYIFEALSYPRHLPFLAQANLQPLMFHRFAPCKQSIKRKPTCKIITWTTWNKLNRLGEAKKPGPADLFRLISGNVTALQPHIRGNHPAIKRWIKEQTQCPRTAGSTPLSRSPGLLRITITFARVKHSFGSPSPLPDMVRKYHQLYVECNRRRHSGWSPCSYTHTQPPQRLRTRRII